MDVLFLFVIVMFLFFFFFFFSSRRRHTRFSRDWSSDVCSSDLGKGAAVGAGIGIAVGAIAGFYESKTKTEREIISQLGDLYLGAKTSKPGLPVSGFVFFPRGDYVGIYVIAVEEPGGAVHEIYGPMVAQPSG